MTTGFGTIENGTRFGRLIVVKDLGMLTCKSGTYKKHLYGCKCDCGKEVRVHRGNLLRGITQSCGCLFNEILLARNTTHGQSKTKEFKIWQGIISRCTLPSATGYKNYGARGITVCERWLHSYENFIQDMGPRPSPEHSVERVDNNGDYTPENCRWATQKEQVYNSRKAVLLTVNGVTAVQSDWARAAGIRQSVLGRRLRSGWSLEKAITTPTRISHKGGMPLDYVVRQIAKEQEAYSYIWEV